MSRTNETSTAVVDSTTVEKPVEDTAGEAAAALRAVAPAGSASTEERLTAALRSAGRNAVAGR